MVKNMKLNKGRYEVFGNPITLAQTRETQKWQEMLAKKFNYDPEENYNLSVIDSPFGKNIFGLKEIIRNETGEAIQKENGIIISTIRMGFGHYRIAMAGASAAQAMGLTPHWLDLLVIPGFPTKLINWFNTEYSKYSRISQRFPLFNKYIWEALTTGEPSLPVLNTFFTNWIFTWPVRFLKAAVKDYKMSELLKNLYRSLPVKQDLNCI